MEPIGGGLGLGRGGEKGALVASKDAQPEGEVGGVIHPLVRAMRSQRWDLTPEVSDRKARERTATPA